MARRTKEDAAETRSRLLDAAERLFSEKGVSRTSLNDIAIAAGTTRGAIYWHFKDKADLFNAMMERVTLPLESTLSRVDTHHSTDPLDDITAAMRNALYLTANDAQVRRVFEVATLKVE
ncbi:MAG: TetR family transcriptional regulator, partial [Burkholderiaceae bacterium]|nr:TetR family transcriptional regulator [Burkholderiaceae bacterium]